MFVTSCTFAAVCCCCCCFSVDSTDFFTGVCACVVDVVGTVEVFGSVTPFPIVGVWGKDDACVASEAFVGTTTSFVVGSLGVLSGGGSVDVLAGVVGTIGTAGIIADVVRFVFAREAGLDILCSLSGIGADCGANPGGMVGVLLPICSLLTFDPV